MNKHEKLTFKVEWSISHSDTQRLTLGTVSECGGRLSWNLNNAVDDMSDQQIRDMAPTIRRMIANHNPKMPISYCMETGYWLERA